MKKINVLAEIQSENSILEMLFQIFVTFRYELFSLWVHFDTIEKQKLNITVNCRRIMSPRGVVEVSTRGGVLEDVLGLEQSLRIHFEVLGLDLEASSPWKLAWPRLEDSTVFWIVKSLWSAWKIFWKTFFCGDRLKNFCETLFFGEHLR